MSINSRIKELREMYGYSIDVVADFLGISTEELFEIEDGATAITSSKLEELSALYGVPVATFFREDSNVNIIKTNFKSEELSAKDLKAISTINRILLNANFMSKLSGQ